MIISAGARCLPAGATNNHHHHDRIAPSSAVQGSRKAHLLLLHEIAREGTSLTLASLAPSPPSSTGAAKRNPQVLTPVCGDGVRPPLLPLAPSPEAAPGEATLVPAGYGHRKNNKKVKRQSKHSTRAAIPRQQTGSSAW